MTNKYELTTIKDIFDKVPADRIETCMAELAELLRQSAVLRDGLQELAVTAGIEVDVATLVKLPDVFEWTDDNLGELTLTVCTSLGDDRVELGQIKSTMGAGR